MERLITKEQFKAIDLWQAATSSWPEIEIKVREEVVNANIKVSIVFCPLYEPGKLEDSKMLKSPSQIQESRVAGKLAGYFSVLGGMSKYLGSVGGSVDVSFVVANKGILLGHEPTNEDYQAISHHNELYKEAVNRFCIENNINYTFSDYQSMNVKFPDFVDLKKPIPTDLLGAWTEGQTKQSILIECFNKFLSLPHKIENNGDNRHVIKGISKMGGGLEISGAFWLIAGYLAFDYQIPGLVGPNGIYLVSERFDPLFSISKLTPSLDKLTRIQIKA